MIQPLQQHSHPQNHSKNEEKELSDNEDLYGGYREN